MTNGDAQQQHQPFRIGEVTVVRGHVHAPGMTFPLAGSRWTVNDTRTGRTRIAPLVVALAVIFGVLLCGLGLLLLLIHETVYEGTIQVTVESGQSSYTTHVVAQHDGAARRLFEDVQYLQRLSAYYANPSTG